MTKEEIISECLMEVRIASVTPGKIKAIEKAMDIWAKKMACEFSIYMETGNYALSAETGKWWDYLWEGDELPELTTEEL